MASGICKPVISIGGRDETLDTFPLPRFLASLQLYEYFLYYDTLNLFRGLYKVSGDLQITGIMGVLVLYYAVPRVFMLVRLVCGH